jgi:outer membrane immunogenic protein
VGGHAGGGWADSELDGNSGAFGTDTPRLQDSFDLEGWLAGGHIGVNLQHGAWVMGGEFSLSAAEIEGSKSDCAAILLRRFGFDERAEFPCKKEDEWLLLAMSRFGYAPGDWMGYVTLGVAVVGAQTGNQDFRDVNGNARGPFPLSAGSSTDVGFAFGGGIEGQLGHGLILGLEYIHADFDDMRDGDVIAVFDYNQDLDIVRARLSLMLNDCCGGAAAAPSKTGFAGILPAAGNAWSGVYFGGHAGYGWGDTDVSTDTFGIDRFNDSFDLEGWLGGAHFGANVQRGDFVYGTELSLSATEIDGSKLENCGGPEIEALGLDLGCRMEDEWLLLAMSRIGYAPANWMAYVTYGLAIVGAQTDFTRNRPDDGFFGLPITSGVNTDVGFAIGGGGEIKLGSMIAGVEYIHADFDDMRNGASAATVIEWEQDIDIVRARLSLMLNDCCDGAGAAPSKMALASAPAAAGGWGGLYFGSHLGYGWADADVSLVLFDESLKDSFDLEGYIAGGHIGANLQRGNLVLGGELSVSAAEIDGSKTQDCLGRPFDDINQDPVDFNCKKEDEWLMLAMARLGYAPGRWMGYVTAGAAVIGAQTDTERSIASQGGQFFPFSAGS